MRDYLESLEVFLRDHDWYDKENEFIALQYEVVDRMSADQIGLESISVVLGLMEKYPLVQFGSPGPLTHYIEDFYYEETKTYEDFIVQSVKRSPGVHTVWLLNRVINDSKQKEILIQLLEDVFSNSTLPSEIRETAKDFWEFQTGL